MQKLKKDVLKILDQLGFGIAARKVYVFLLMLPRNLFVYPFCVRAYHRQIDCMDLGEAKRIFYWPGSFGWNVVLFQRPQQMALACGRQGQVTLYEVTGRTDPHVTDYFEQAPGVWLVNRENWTARSVLMRRIRASGVPHYVTMYSTNLEFSRRQLTADMKKGDRLLYEYVDHLDASISKTRVLPPVLTDRFNWVAQHDEIPVVATADALWQDIYDHRGERNLALIPNGVDHMHFHPLAELGDEAKANLGQIRHFVCYYGALASWIDYDLLRYAAEQMPDVDFVLIGQLYDDSFRTSGVEALANIHYLGPIEYYKLPATAGASAVFTIPFRCGDLAQATSPIKLFEYMAMNRPIVTSSMAECRKYRSVMVAEDKEQFVTLLRKALGMSEQSDADYFADLRREALENTWDARAEAMDAFLTKYEAGAKTKG